MEILERYKKTTGGQAEDLIFPILDKNKHLAPQQIENRIKRVLKQVNGSLKELVKQVGILVNLTTYVARHTYATVLKQSGVSTGVISEALGHKGEQITQTYLKSFSNEVIDEDFRGTYSLKQFFSPLLAKLLAINYYKVTLCNYYKKYDQKI
ncbi:MAG: hypothetical protein BGO68_00025 [Candidatus Amoebophilus sp. 36-38]|nr:MAG: hypothetical protein BGO68_00025 [Candidatus Amoebophilus sp. 36-38]